MYCQILKCVISSEALTGKQTNLQENQLDAMSEKLLADSELSSE